MTLVHTPINPFRQSDENYFFGFAINTDIERNWWITILFDIFLFPVIHKQLSFFCL